MAVVTSSTNAVTGVMCQVLSVCSFLQVPAQSNPGQLRTDAAVNAANALTSWAELVQNPDQHQLLTQAVELYRSGLQQEEDALVGMQHW